MGKIRILDEQLANQIAAGEVVERPASVVKELVENAVDAGSTAIDIAVEEGGISLIRVTDNGSGIDPDDLETAFQRHATSKIASGSDLFRIASLGFRGEALPSIAAVSRVECVSASDDSGLGRRLAMNGGTVVASEPVNAPRGTDITVRDLFYNTPARLKYMKSIQTELGHLSDYVNRIALAHPGIAFTLRHNGNLLLRTTGGGDRLQVIAAIYGTNTAKAMLKVSAEHPDYDLNGYISKPELTRANRNGLTVIVNGRTIRSYIVNQAVIQAYHTLLPINRYPLAVLEIGMHPSLIDVNVHPSKMEVRFSKEAELREFVEHAVRDALSGIRHIPGPDAGARDRSKPVYVQGRIAFHRAEDGFGDGPRTYAPGAAGAAGSRPDSRNIPRDATERLYAPAAMPQRRDDGGGAVQDSAAVREADNAAGGGLRAETMAAGGNDDGLRTYAPGRTEPPAAPSWREAAPAAEAYAAEASSGTDAAGASGGTAESGLDAAETAGAGLPDGGAEPGGPRADAFPELSWIGQLHGTYIVAQNEEGLYLIDQHAAHERIHYEFYLGKFANPQPASQPLLVPMTLEYTPAEAALLRERLDTLAEAGIGLEPFGPHGFLVRYHPEWLPKGEEQALVEEMIEWVLSEKRHIDIGKLREKAAIMCSCKASIKANQRLTREEGETLIRRLAACRQPYTCPHGRPIVVHMSTYQLEKMFKRVMS
ncbi:DNA mismatch repair endonuclease MutL [Paenibacillus cisolokensis]|uniref:DNA mismatch repair endonuclease MutL n=1 Tax=Paenibacillus cisolokensis TaxID=1658519 RepID=UPI003D2E818B